MYRIIFSSNFKLNIDAWQKDVETLEEAKGIFNNFFYRSRDVILKELLYLKKNALDKEAKKILTKLYEVIHKTKPYEKFELLTPQGAILTIDELYMRYNLAEKVLEIKIHKIN